MSIQLPELPPIVAEITAIAPPGVWLVGGAVRDALLGRRLHDLDFVVAGDALAVARRVGDALAAPFYPLDAERGVGRVMFTRDEERYTLDFAQMRGPNLAADLAARDFTLNAMAADLADPETLIDPLGGHTDLRTHVVRACGPNAIAADPVRGIRAVRLAAQLNFRLDPATRAAVRAQAEALAGVSAERRRDEFVRCLGGRRPAAALRVLEALGLLPYLVPELAALKGMGQSPPHTYDGWEHTLETVARLAEVLGLLGPVHDVDAASDLTLGLVSVRLGRHRQALSEHLSTPLAGDRPARWTLMLAALLHDIGKPLTRSVEPDGRVRFIEHERVGADLARERLAELRFSSDEIRRAGLIVAHHLRPLHLASGQPVSGRAVYRFFRDTGPAGVDVVLLSLADCLATYGGNGPPPTEAWNRLLEVGARLLQAYFEQPRESVRPPALITGDDLMAELGLPPGPHIGKLLEAVREAQAEGEVADRAAALAFVRERLADNDR